MGSLLLLAICLGIYNLRLKAEYQKGAYTDPYYNYEKLPYQDFDEIELRSSTAVSVKVVRGDFKVLAMPMEFLKVRQEGRKLILSAQFMDQYYRVNGFPIVYVSCPILLRFRADAEYVVKEDTVVDRTALPGWMQSTITGFREDSLVIQEDHGANVELAADTIGKVTARLGGSAGLGRNAGLGNGPLLSIEDNNQIDVTDFHVLDQGRLSIKGTGIRQLTYTLADDASLTVNGVAVRYLNHH
jgi:hypothetical protein